MSETRLPKVSYWLMYPMMIICFEYFYLSAMACVICLNYHS